VDFADGGAAGIAATDPAKDANGGGARIGKRMTEKEIVLFGTGVYFENYMMCHRLDGKRLMAVDNDGVVSIDQGKYLVKHNQPRCSVNVK